MHDSNAPILIIDDDHVDAEIVRRALSTITVLNPVEHRDSGDRGLAFLREQRDRGEVLPLVILLDINMPGMSGIEVLDALKNEPELCRIPVVMLTTSAEQGDRYAGYGGGAAGYIVKPVDFTALVEAMRTLDFYWTLCEAPH